MRGWRVVSNSLQPGLSSETRHSARFARPVQGKVLAERRSYHSPATIIDCLESIARRCQQNTGFKPIVLNALRHRGCTAIASVRCFSANRIVWRPGWPPRSCLSANDPKGYGLRVSPSDSGKKLPAPIRVQKGAQPGSLGFQASRACVSGQTAKLDTPTGPRHFGLTRFDGDCASGQRWTLLAIPLDERLRSW